MYYLPTLTHGDLFLHLHVCVSFVWKFKIPEVQRSLKLCNWEFFEDLLEGEDFSLLPSGCWVHHQPGTSLDQILSLGFFWPCGWW